MVYPSLCTQVLIFQLPSLVRGSCSPGTSIVWDVTQHFTLLRGIHLAEQLVDNATDTEVLDAVRSFSPGQSRPSFEVAESYVKECLAAIIHNATRLKDGDVSDPTYTEEIKSFMVEVSRGFGSLSKANRVLRAHFFSSTSKPGDVVQIDNTIEG